MLLRRLGHLTRSLYARIALVYLLSLLALSAAAAWIAVSQFNQLSGELEQRAQTDLARHIAQMMAAPLEQGPEAPAARAAARSVLSVNPSLLLYVLDADGRVIGNYADTSCLPNARVDVSRLEYLLGGHPMLPVETATPCSDLPSVFSVARVRYGPGGQPGFLLAVLDAGPKLSMFSMLRTSSITRTLVVSGVLALLISAVAGLLLFALMTRRFSRLTEAVRRFADGDYRQRIAPGHDDEIGELGRAFNDMAGTIEAQLNALREIDRQRRDLVAGLSHDFRTPLTSLRGYAEQLRSAHDAPPETRQAQLDAILANTERLTRLAQQLSALTRADALEQPLSMEPFSLSELVYDIAGKFAPQAQAAGVSLGVQGAPEDIRVAADIALIDRLLANLIDNAVHATPSGGSVQIEISARAGRADVQVTDTGCGIGADELPLVTQRFYRTAASRSRGEGSGLGLAIAKEICARHGTRLVIESVPGRGTRVRFKLRLA
jgi:signal transduction histidine kinase